MKITLNSGKTFDVNWIGASSRYGDKMMIELNDDRKISQIAADFEGVETITKTDKAKPNVKEVYEGYTLLASISRENADGVIRLTLEKGRGA